MMTLIARHLIIERDRQRGLVSLSHFSFGWGDYL
jgi:hypothetical protein